MIRKGKHWMIQLHDSIGLSFGVHVPVVGLRYIDIHLPCTIITLGDLSEVEYPPDHWMSSREVSMGVKFADYK